QRGLQGFSAFFPLGGANFTRVGSDVLSSLDLAQQLGSDTADTVVVNFHYFDVAFGVNHESTAQGNAFFFNQHVEVASERVGRVTDHRVVHLTDGVGRVVPSLVREVCVGRHGIDLNTQLLEFSVLIGQVFQFSRTYEREVGRVENEHGPLARNRFVADVYKLAVMVGSCLKRLDLRIDQGHTFSLCWVGETGNKNKYRCPRPINLIDCVYVVDCVYLSEQPPSGIAAAKQCATANRYAN